jgi:hypothetical protein
LLHQFTIIVSRVVSVYFSKIECLSLFSSISTPFLHSELLAVRPQSPSQYLPYILNDLCVLPGERPMFASYTPGALRALAEACWHEDPAQRPPFRDVVTTLSSMLEGKRSLSSSAGGLLDIRDRPQQVHNLCRVCTCFRCLLPILALPCLPAVPSFVHCGCHLHPLPGRSTSCLAA